MNFADRLCTAFEYRVCLGSGREMDRPPEGEPLGFVVGSGRVIRGLEKALMGRAAGEPSRPWDGCGCDSADRGRCGPSRKGASRSP